MKTKNEKLKENLSSLNDRIIKRKALNDIISLFKTVSERFYKSKIGEKTLISTEWKWLLF